MRPKKRILLIDNDAERRGVMAFVLRCWGYKVLANAPGMVELALVRYPISVAQCARLKKKHKCPLLAVAPVSKSAPYGAIAEGRIYAQQSMAELLEKVKLLCARKRGPKKGFKKLFPKAVAA